MKILLISSNRLNDPYPVYPIGLDYVAGALRAKHEVKILDLNRLEGDRDLMSGIKAFFPDLIGVSLRNVDNTDSSDPKGFMAGYAKMISVIKGCSKAPVVLGGCGFTIFPEEILNTLGGDFGLAGEGERFSMLADALEANLPVDQIPGVILKGSGGQIPEPLREVPRRWFQKESDHLDYYLKKGGMLNLQTKRGCCFRCIYCTYPHIEGRKLRLIPPKEVAETARSLQDAGAGYIFITDSAFNASFDHSLKVAQAFKKAGVSIPWGAFFAPLVPPVDYFKKMADSGLKHVEFGTESLCDAVLSSYGKPFKVEDVFNAHRAAVDAELHVAHYILPGGPGETENTMDETLLNVDKLNKTVLFFFCGMRIYPHTDLYDIALSEGVISSSDDLLKPVFYRGRLGLEQIVQRVESAKNNRPNWIVGSGGDDTSDIIQKMYERGFTGPLWEYLIR